MPASTPKKDFLKREQFAKLENNYLIQRQAALKYKIPFMTLYRWAQNPKLIRTKNSDGNTLVNEADIAYCALMRKKRGSGRGKQTFNDDGTLFKRKPKDLTQR